MTRPAPQWEIAGSSVTGALHHRNDLPNQDALAWWQDDRSLPAILSVADGHGSARYFRSAAGAELAVRTATDVLRGFVLDHDSPTSLLAIKRSAEEGLPKSIVRRWQDAVTEHLNQQPLSTEEAGMVDENRTIPYGATILSALVTRDYILYLQLGDGDILVVQNSGEVTRPIPADHRLIANETTSLCLRDSWNDFRVAFQPLNGESPALILLATDGYSNSFRSKEDFDRVGSDLLEFIRVDGLDTVRASLPDWLREASEQGSGDDITVGLLVGLLPSIEAASAESASDFAPQA